MATLEGWNAKKLLMQAYWSERKRWTDQGYMPQTLDERPDSEKQYVSRIRHHYCVTEER